MDRIINVKVGGNYLIKDNKNAGVRGEANVTRLRITFDDGWITDEYAKRVVFWDARGLNPVVVDLLPTLLEKGDDRTYLVPIPGEPMAEAGMLTFVIEGTKDDKVQRSLSDTLEVKDSPIAENAGQPVPPTPDELTQIKESLEEFKDGIIEEVTPLKTDAVIARNEAYQFSNSANFSAQDALAYKTDAESAASSADSNARRAEEYAERIKNLQVSAFSGTVAGVKKTETSNGIKLSFTLPKGEKGDEGPKGNTGERGPQGIQGPKGDKGDKGDTPQKGVDYFTPEDIEALNIPNDEVKSLQYYGDASVVPSDASLFIFTTDDSTMTATVMSLDPINGDVVVPYEHIKNGKVYKVTSIADIILSADAGITIPSSVTNIKDTFDSNLVWVSLPNTIKGDYNLFGNCKNLSNIYFRGTLEEWGQFTTSKVDARIHYKWTEGVLLHKPDITPDMVDVILTDGSVAMYDMPLDHISVSFPDVEIGYTSMLYFSTPSKELTDYSTFPEETIFKGDSTEDGKFIPESNTRYTMVFDYDGVSIIGYVSGVSL